MRTLALLLTALSAAALAGCHFTAQGQNLQGVERFKVGDYNGAATHFQQALRTNPNNADAHYNLGALYHRYAETNRDPNLLAIAEREYQQSLVLDPNHLDARRGYTVLLTQTNRSAEAYASLRQWAEKNPRSANPQIELARLYQVSGDKASAEQLMTQAMQIDPNNAQAWAVIGKLREDSGDYSAALANYQRAYQLNPTTQVATRDKIIELQSRGVNASPLGTPLGTPLPAAVQSAPRMVNAPGPMRRF
jgi:tetratricopeptide (TPR) repeat protein